MNRNGHLNGNMTGNGHMNGNMDGKSSGNETLRAGKSAIFLDDFFS